MKLTDIFLVTQNWKGLCEHNFLTTLKEIEKEYGPKGYLMHDDLVDYADWANITYIGNRCTSIAQLKSFVLFEDNIRSFEEYLKGNGYDPKEWEDWYCDLDFGMCDKAVLAALPQILEEYAQTSSAEDLQIIRQTLRLCA